MTMTTVRATALEKKKGSGGGGEQQGGWWQWWWLWTLVSVDPSSFVPTFGQQISC